MSDTSIASIVGNPPAEPLIVAMALYQATALLLTYRSAATPRTIIADGLWTIGSDTSSYSS
ncbi:MAG: hypothetical protein EOP45_19005 [Sphingobacteriaceae bacterium]|nr:MAG: hypothetical protein EOP45_19005 [Sphingobacteriaceae bacterium]